MHAGKLCPFSKPLVSQWCQCPHARLTDRCSGKMIWNHDDVLRDSCVDLANVLKQKSRFISGLSNEDAELTHAQLMQIRSGELLGMHRVLGSDDGVPPVVRDVICITEDRYGVVLNFPYDEIMQDIKSFNHRRKKGKQAGINNDHA